MNDLPCACRSLLILAALGCFDRYKFDYSPNSSDIESCIIWSDSQIEFGARIAMPPSLTQRTKRTGKRSQAVAGLGRWKLEDAKARFSEVVRLAGTEGPQLVTIRGKEAAVIIAPEEYKQLLPKPKNHLPLVHFLQGLGLHHINVTRDKDTGREIAL